MAYVIALIGGGGVGKSTLAFAFANYLGKKGLRTQVANLDPGCKHIKYKPFYDIRKHYSLDKVMKKENLGPNGALKKIYGELNGKIARELRKADADIVILDTAGSIELFLLEGAADFLKKSSDAVLFVTDAESAGTPSDLKLLRAVNAIQTLRYALPTITVVNKSDLLEKKGKNKQRTLAGGFQAVDEHLGKLLEEIGRNEHVLFVSAWEGDGFKALFDAINELKCACGDFS
jgi:MinD-like ATPase involved in chromosome partitioning or flagellar assembly